MTLTHTETPAYTVATPTVRKPGPGRAKRTFVKALRRLPVWIVVAILMVVVLYPQVWMVLGSFKTQSEFLSNPALSLPETWNFDNYVTALTNGNVARNWLNSVLVTIPSVLFIVFIGVAAGYALEVMIWRGRNGILLYILAGIMVPGQMILVPLFITYFRIGITDTLWPLIITYTVMGLPLTTFLMATYFRSVPREIFEAATVDGSGPLRSFFVIGIPMMKNAILTVGLVQFFSVWNDLLIALTFTTRPDLATIQVGLLSLSDEYGSTQYGPLFAAVSINIVVLLILFLTLNKKIMAGMSGGALKG